MLLHIFKFFYLNNDKLEKIKGKRYYILTFLYLNHNKLEKIKGER
jgi:hypothetical protein